MNDSGWERKLCASCGGSAVVLRRRINTNGAVAFVWWCDDCGKYATKYNQNIPHDVIRDWRANKRLRVDPDSVPICVDLRNAQHCEICGAAGAELHHFAPQSLRCYFGDEWVRWPTIYLCKTHHDLWHSIVTPNMPHVRHTEIAKAVMALR